ncbi:hypothetical protein RHSIM_Rhsim05G0188800 [Rhododendron simsii]|uniref:Uncharacterized protein n=1 Tax=Rhododendron simsii TaxID=118357 RepID=A0A834LPD7_RHOSS|nr:hypothetical protein RHSIM_Rhsim05G0188800 [Rhododendron simsii]
MSLSPFFAFAHGPESFSSNSSLTLPSHWSSNDTRNKWENHCIFAIGNPWIRGISGRITAYIQAAACMHVERDKRIKGKNKLGHGAGDEEFLPPEGEENLSVYSDDDESSRSQAKKFYDPLDKILLEVSRVMLEILEYVSAAVNIGEEHVSFDDSEDETANVETVNLVTRIGRDYKLGAELRYLIQKKEQLVEHSK